MCHDEWLTSRDPGKMLHFLTARQYAGNTPVGDMRISERKLRLLAAECFFICYGHRLPSNSMWRKWEDGEPDTCTTTPLVEATSWITNRERARHYPAFADLLREIANDPFRPADLVWMNTRLYLRPERERLIGDDISDLTPVPWLTDLVTNLATTAYDQRDWGILPILADALEDAGLEGAREHDWMSSGFTTATAPCRRCGVEWATDAHRKHGNVCQPVHPILIHLRDEHARHARGCWALDLILNKE